MTDKEIFKSLCYGREVKVPESAVFKYCRPGVVCRHCQKPIKEEDFAVHSGYWFPHTWYPCHKGCLSELAGTEAYDCQVIDADCNDCKHFERGKQVNASGTLSRTLFPAIGTKPGYCSKRSCNVEATPNHCSNFPCFEHRKKR